MSYPITTGVLLEADKPTINGRIYSREVLEKAIAAYQANPGYGQFYTDAWPPQDSPSINLAKVSHRIKNLHLTETGHLIGEVEVLKTPMGNVLADLLTQGEVKFVPTGYGIVAADGTISDYTLTSIDIVRRDD